MKNFILSVLFIAFAFTVNAQLASKVRTLKVINQGEFVSYNSTLKDTLKSNDTLAYVLPITHIANVSFELELRSKIVANDTTVTVKFFESIDGVNYYSTVAGSSPSAYTKTFAKGASDVIYVSASDICWFKGRYLKIMFIGATKTGLKKCLYGNIKTVIN